MPLRFRNPYARGADDHTASFNEKLLLSNGLVISPLKNHSNLGQHSRSLKEVIQAVDNAKDLEDHLVSFHSQVPPTGNEPRYERNPVLNPQQNQSSTQMPPPPARPPSNPQPSSMQMAPPPQASMGSRSGPFDIGPPGGPPGAGQNFGPPSMPAAVQSRPTSQTGHERSVSHGALLNQPSMAPTHQQPYSNRNSTQAAPPSHMKYGGNSISQAGPPQLGALPFQTQQQPPQSQSPPDQFAPMAAAPNPVQQPPSSSRSDSPPSTVMAPSGPGGPRSKQVFGVTLDRLYERDGLAVPMVVYQCIQAVDLFGLAVEGIYRLSGSATHIQKLKNGFDTGT